MVPLFTSVMLTFAVPFGLLLHEKRKIDGKTPGKNTATIKAVSLEGFGKFNIFLNRHCLGLSRYEWQILLVAQFSKIFQKETYFAQIQNQSKSLL